MKKALKKSPIVFGLLSLIAFITFAKQEKVIQIFSKGEIVQEYPIDAIDYIEINDLIPAPDNVNASVTNNQITIKWSPVEGATYNLYRSPDNTNFTLLASKLTETNYTDTKPLRGSNFYRVKAVIGDVESGFSHSVTATLTNEVLDSGIYLGITGFNQAIYDFEVVKLTESSVSGFNNFIDGLIMKNGTLLYYSVDQALNTLQATELPSDISTAAIVTFTDGLDQGSFMMDGVSYDDEMEYLDALNRRIKNETVSGQPITAYSIGIRGKDVSDINMFRTNLAKLASSADNATEVTSMAEVNAKFKEIAEQLSQSNYVQTINLKMPGLSNGTRVRFTFDNVNAANKSQIYIEGKFNLKDKSLEEVQYVGLTSTSGTIVKGTVDGIFVNFAFEGVHTDNNVLIKSEFTDEWTYVASNNTWQINSEFDKTENSDIVTERSSAVIMLVLDCSSSLADDFVKAQTNAKDFINKLLENSANPYEVSSVTLDANDITLGIGNSYTLTAMIHPSTALLKSIIWTSSNESIVSVNQNGIVTGISSGKAEVKATSKDGDHSAICKVWVITHINSLTLTPASVIMHTGETLEVTASYSPINADITNLKWSSTNVDIATVDQNGVITASSKGEAIICATTTDGSNIEANCYVKVLDNGHDYINGHEYVDLGLPSGLKWATNSMSGSFAWGEIETKSNYLESNSITTGKNLADFSGNPQYDVARAQWGGSWRMPRKSDYEELITKCRWDYKWLTGPEYGYYGTGGFVVTGPNGNTLIIPIGSGGSEIKYYWTSTPYNDNYSLAYSLRLGGTYHNIQELDYSYRFHALEIIAVSD